MTLRVNELLAKFNNNVVLSRVVKRRWSELASELRELTPEELAEYYSRLGKKGSDEIPARRKD